MADALDSGSSGSNTVQVQVLLPAPRRSAEQISRTWFQVCDIFILEFRFYTLFKHHQYGRSAEQISRTWFQVCDIFILAFSLVRYEYPHHRRSAGADSTHKNPLGFLRGYNLFTNQ